MNKIQKSSSNYSGEGLAKFVSRLHTIQPLRHSNIVSLHDVKTNTAEQEAESNLLHLIFEKVPNGWNLGESDKLHSVCRGGEGNHHGEAAARCLFRQLVRGLRHAHKRNVVHGNLKLTNVMLAVDESTGQVTLKLTDFGVDETDGMFQNTRSGPPYHLAPEILKGDFQWGTSEADLWSLGGILFWLLSQGELPWTGSTMAIVMRIAQGIVTYPDYFSPESKDLLTGLFQSDPHLRLTLDQVIAHPWFQDDGLYSPTFAGEDAAQHHRGGCTRDLYGWMMEWETLAACPRHCEDVHSAIPQVLVPADLVDHCCTFVQRDDSLSSSCMNVESVTIPLPTI